MFIMKIQHTFTLTPQISECLRTTKDKSKLINRLLAEHFGAVLQQKQVIVEKIEEIDKQKQELHAKMLSITEQEEKDKLISAQASKEGIEKYWQQRLGNYRRTTTPNLTMEDMIKFDEFRRNNKNLEFREAWQIWIDEQL